MNEFWRATRSHFNCTSQIVIEYSATSDEGGWLFGGLREYSERLKKLNKLTSIICIYRVVLDQAGPQPMLILHIESIEYLFLRSS